MPDATPGPVSVPMVVANVSFRKMELHSSRIAIFHCSLCGLAMASSYDDGSPLIAVAASHGALTNNSDAATRAVAMLLVILLERDSGAAIGSDDDDDDGVVSIARPHHSAALLTRPRAAAEYASLPLDSMWNSSCLPVMFWSL